MLISGFRVWGLVSGFPHKPCIISPKLLLGRRMLISGFREALSSDYSTEVDGCSTSGIGSALFLLHTAPTAASDGIRPGPNPKPSTLNPKTLHPNPKP